MDPEPNPLVRGAEPDPHQNVTDPQHWAEHLKKSSSLLLGPGVEHPAQAGLQRLLHDSHGPVQVCARRQTGSFGLILVELNLLSTWNWTYNPHGIEPTIHVELNLLSTWNWTYPPTFHPSKRSILWHLRIVSEHKSLRLSRLFSQSDCFYL